MISNTPTEFSFPFHEAHYTAQTDKVQKLAMFVYHLVEDANDNEFDKVLSSFNKIIEGFIAHKVGSATPEQFMDAFYEAREELDNTAVIVPLLAACCAIKNSFAFVDNPSQ